MKKILKFAGILMLTSVISCDWIGSSDKDSPDYYHARTHVLAIDAAVKSRYPSAYLTSVEYLFDTVKKTFPPTSLKTTYSYNLYGADNSGPSGSLSVSLNDQLSVLDPIESKQINEDAITFTPVGMITIEELFSLIHYEWEGAQPLISKVQLCYFLEENTSYELLYKLWGTVNPIGHYNVHSRKLEQYK